MKKRKASVDVFNMKREKLCCLYDSSTEAHGQAHSIVYRKEIGGYKSLSFILPRIMDGEKNFRWDFIRNELLIRLTLDGKRDWFIIQAPSKSQSKSGMSQSVTCGHVS